MMAASIIHIHTEAPRSNPCSSTSSEQTNIFCGGAFSPPANSSEGNEPVDRLLDQSTPSFDGRQRKEEWYEIIDHALASKERKKIEISTYQDQEILLFAFCLACPATAI